jgi:4-amino-4-deoxy-L-arabinose transferase-like glycosyltransferase
MKNLLARFRPTTRLHWILLVIVVIGAFLRLVNFVPGLMFQGDQGRDAIIARNILINHDIVLIGPVTSTGNMYLGPLYYYFMVPFLLLSYPSPTGPALAIAGLSILTIFLMYVLGKELIGAKGATLAAGMFALSTIAITYARFSWNPNPAPLVSLILIWAIYQAMHRKHWYWVLASFCIAVLVQLHYVTLLTIPATGTLWLITVLGMIREQRNGALALSSSSGRLSLQRKKTAKAEKKSVSPSKVAQTLHSSLFTLFLSTVIASVLFISSFAPLVVFDLRHQGLNFKAFQTFLAQDQGTVKVESTKKVFKVIRETQGRSMQILTEQFFGKNRFFNMALTLAIIVMLCYLWSKRGKDKWHSPELILLTFLFWAVIGLAFYQSSVFVHYILYLLPISFLIYGTLFTFLWSKKGGKVITILLAILYLGFNLTHLSIQTAGWPITGMKETAQSILTRVQPGEKYNLVLLSGSGDIDGQNIRYFLETSDKPPVTTQERGEVQTLFIINDDRKLKKVVDSPVYEIVVFPNKQPTEVYTIPNGPEITVLRK